MRTCACLLFFALGTSCARPNAPPAHLRPQPPSAAALFDHGTRLARRGDSVRAEQYLVAALEHGYPEERGLPWLLRVCIEGSRLRSAVRHASLHLERHPDELELEPLVATLLVALGERERARSRLERALERASAKANAPARSSLLELYEELAAKPASSRAHTSHRAPQRADRRAAIRADARAPARLAAHAPRAYRVEQEAR